VLCKLTQEGIEDLQELFDFLELETPSLPAFIWQVEVPSEGIANSTGAPVVFHSSPFEFGIYQPIPEPATGLLALAGIALLIRRKRR